MLALSHLKFIDAYIDATIRISASAVTVFVVHFLQVQWPHSNFLEQCQQAALQKTFSLRQQVSLLAVNNLESI